jgi:hypothetical protein
MSEWIGDLMAVADERYAWGDGRKRRGKGAGGKKKMEAQGAEQNPHFSQKMREMGQPAEGKCTGPSGRKERRLQGDNSAEGRKRLPPKMMGELGELDFLRKAMGMGMIVSKPWGDSYRYDFVCDTGGKMWRSAG